MTAILRRLQSTKFIEFADLFDPSRGVPVVVVNFVALLELAKETLIEIKSRMLLPVRKADTGEEAADPRAELVRRLLEYEQMKLASQQIDALPQLGRDYVRTQIYIEQSIVTRWPEVEVVDLQQAWADLLKRAKLTAHYMISR